MADEELLQSMDELGDEEEDGEEGGGGSPLLKYLPLIGIVLVVQVIIGYVLVTLLFSPSEEEEESLEEEVATEVVEETQAGAPALTSVKDVYEHLDIVVVNPAGTEGLRFVSAKVNLGLSDPLVVQYIDDNKLKSKMQDHLTTIFASKTIAQLDPANHPALKEEIVERLNSFLGSDAVLEVYFPSFVLQ